MKKFFEKHDLFKLAGIFVLISVILSWVISYSYYTDGTLASEEITRIGVFDLTTYGLLGFYYFTVIFMFIFIVAGFYKFLGSVDAYDKLTDNIAKFFTGKEKILVAISTLLFACLSGISTEYMVLLGIIPLVISILSKLKVDKITGLIATFGGVLVGIIGSTYSTKIVGVLADSSIGVGVTYGYELVGTIILFAISYLLITYFALARMSKVKDDKNVALLVDPFATEKVEEKKSKKKDSKKISVLPLVIVLVITFITLILAFIGWEAAFGITVFTDALTWITEATLFNETVYSYILGKSLVAFGKWDLLAACGMLFIATLIIKILYHIPFDKVLDGYTDGFKKIGKSIVVVMVIYLVLELSVIYPTIPAVVEMIMGLGSNIGTLFASGFLTSVFTVDFQYTVSIIGSLFANFSNVNVAALALQASYGVCAFIAPTSVMLMLGLSMLDIKFKDYFKFIWKFLLALIVVVLIVLAILMYV